MFRLKNTNGKVNSKDKCTFYTPQKVAQARENINKYSWAIEIKNSVAEKAEKLLSLGYEHFWYAVTTQSLPRSYSVNQINGCLNCGKQIDKYGRFPYKLEVIKAPWKLQCPNCNMIFPTNDFEAFYKSGLDEHGIFDYDKTDKSYLRNVEYPDRGEFWGTDNGFGYVTEEGERYTYIAYYNHWNWCVTNISESISNSSISIPLKIFRDAYIYTGDTRYAIAGTIILDRIADVYPDMNISKYPRDKGFLNSCGLTEKGKVLGCIWETDLIKSFLYAYDAFYPAMEEPELVGFLSAKARQYRLNNPKNSGELIKKNIEDNIVRQVYPAVRNASVRGNMGMHQSALALAAVVLDTKPETEEWLDYIFMTNNLNKAANGNILAVLINDVDRDGHGNEAAPGYNILWLSNYIEMADILKDYSLYPKADLYKIPKVKKMFKAMYPLVMGSDYFLNVGDTEKTGNPSDIRGKLLNISYKAYEIYEDKFFAQMIYHFGKGIKAEDFKDIFMKDPSIAMEEAEKTVQKLGCYRQESKNLSGFGLAVLRNGTCKLKEKHMTEYSNDKIDCYHDLWIYYGKNTGHGHRDTLNIGIHAFGLDLSPDLGYPEYADNLDKHRHEWVNKTVSHNTVVVDKMSQGNQLMGLPINFDSKSDIVKLFDIQASIGVYTQTETYRRTCITIKVDEKNAYIIDLFRVNGGNDHYYSFHGAEGSVKTEGLNLVKQTNNKGEYTGSYDGPDVNWGERRPDDSIPTPGYMGAGFHFLKNVDKDHKVRNQFSVDWSIKDTWKVLDGPEDIHLRLTMLGSIDDVALADGIPPRNKPGNPDSLKYMIAHRKVGELKNDLFSLFLSVIEPYKNYRFIKEISPVDISQDGKSADNRIVSGVKITLNDGRIDYLVQSVNTDSIYEIDGKFIFKGFCGAYFEKDGIQTGYYLYDGTIIGSYDNGKQTCVKGRVTDFTKTLEMHNYITLELIDMEIDVEELTGNYIYIKNDGMRNACYLIESIKEKQGNLVTFNIGDITLIRSFADSQDFSKGYIYDICEGADARIPFSLERHW